ncbi:MAG: beta-lactamase family protein, partial [Acidimicrobiia bacterium]|nr:beta-lactamase family protein [Acidimicrobiia bacterium]
VDTGFSVPADDLPRMTANYMPTPKGLALLDKSERTGYRHPARFLGGGGGLVSTLADYQRFCDMLLAGGALDGQRVIGRKTIEFMTRNHLPGGRLLNDMGQSTFTESVMEGTGFGLGFSVVVDPAASGAVTSPGVYSWGGAASTAFWIDPVEELTVVFLTQLLPSNTYPIRRQLQAAVYGALV